MTKEVIINLETKSYGGDPVVVIVRPGTGPDNPGEIIEVKPVDKKPVDKNSDGEN